MLPPPETSRLARTYACSSLRTRVAPPTPPVVAPCVGGCHSSPTQVAHPTWVLLVVSVELRVHRIFVLVPIRLLLDVLDSRASRPVTVSIPPHSLAKPYLTSPYSGNPTTNNQGRARTHAVLCQRNPRPRTRRQSSHLRTTRSPFRAPPQKASPTREMALALERIPNAHRPGALRSCQETQFRYMPFKHDARCWVASTKTFTRRPRSACPGVTHGQTCLQ